MVPDRQKVRTDGRTEWTDGRTDNAKTISLRLRRGIINWVEGPQGDATYQRPCGFRQEDVFMYC